MSQTVRDQVFSGVKWNSLGTIGQYGAQFVVSIILARLLLPSEFGLIGMLAIFTAISRVFIDSGMTAAIIQKKDVNNTDYSTVFFYNIAIALVFYFLLFFSAQYIADFYKQPELAKLTKYISLVFVINSFGTVQATILRKDLNFKKLNIISIIGVFIAGFVAIIMAFAGYGVYSIVGQSIAFALITNLIYWITSAWKPKFVFSKQSFKNLFGFGSKLLVSALLDQTYTNLSTLIIGKAFSASQLGYFTRAQATRDLPAQNVTGVLNSIVFPILTKSKNDEELVRHHLKFIGLISFVILPIMTGLAIVAEPVTVLLFSSKWLPSVRILQLLCIIGPVYPLSVILVSTILAKGNSSLFLKLDIYKKIFGLCAMLIGLYYGFYPFLVGIIASGLIALGINFFFTGRYLNVRFWQYLSVVLPSFVLTLFMGVILFLLQYILPSNHFLQLLILSILGFIIYAGMAHLIKSKDYIYLKVLVKEKFFTKKVITHDN